MRGLFIKWSDTVNFFHLIQCLTVPFPLLLHRSVSNVFHHTFQLLLYEDLLYASSLNWILAPAFCQAKRESNFSSSFKCFPPRLYGKSRILKTVDKTFNSWICLILLRLTLKFIFYVHFKAWALGHQFQHIVLNTIQNIINRQAPFLSNVDTSKYIISVSAQDNNLANQYSTEENLAQPVPADFNQYMFYLTVLYSY